jgi:hypothetical protein
LKRASFAALPTFVDLTIEILCFFYSPPQVLHPTPIGVTGPVASSSDSHTFSTIDEAYEESKMAIAEGHKVLNEIGGSAATDDDDIMGDETAHYKRDADAYEDSEEEL